MSGVVRGIFGGDEPETPTTDYRAAWDTYSGWMQQENLDLEAQMSQAKSSMAASGIRAGTPGWDQRLQGVRREYDKRMTELRGTDTYQMLASNPAVGGGNVEAYYEREYGLGQRPANAGGRAAPAKKPGPAEAGAVETTTLKSIFPWLTGDSSEDTLWLGSDRGPAD